MTTTTHNPARPWRAPTTAPRPAFSSSTTANGGARTSGGSAPFASFAQVLASTLSPGANAPTSTPPASPAGAHAATSATGAPGAATTAAGAAGAAGAVTASAAAPGMSAASAQMIAEAVKQLEAHKRALVREAKAAAVEVGLRVARHVVGHEIASTPDAVVSAAERAIERMAGATSVTVRVHPDDVGILEVAGLTSSDETGGGGGGARVVGDRALRRGDCIIETDQGAVDGRVETRLKAIADAAFASLTDEVG